MGIMYKLMKHRNFSMDLSKTVQHFENPSNIKTDRNRLITIDGNIIEAPVTQTMDPEEDILNQSMDSNMDKQFTAEHIIQLCKFLAEKSKRNKNLYKQQQSPKKLTKSKQTQFQFQQMECDDDVDNDSEEIDLYQNEALPLLTMQQQQQQQKQQQGKHNDEDNESEKQQQHQQKITRILSSRLSPDINSLNISSNTLTTSTCALQHCHHHHHHHHQQQQQERQQQPQQLNQQEQQQQQLFNYQYQQQQQQQHQQHEEHQYNQGKRDILLKIRRQIFERKRLRENGAFEGPQILNNAQVWRPW